MDLGNRAGALRAISCLGLVFGAYASPTINLAVRTAFTAPPFLVELLETAAEENATSYFPILDRIADGFFDASTSDQELYTNFRRLLEHDGHLSRPEDLSSFDLALSLHSTAPRIEAHFQYYNTSIQPSVGQEQRIACENWVHVPVRSQKHCGPEFDDSKAQLVESIGHTAGILPIDRILGDAGSIVPSILYADITSEGFRKFHKTLSETAKLGKSSYRVRYLPSNLASLEPLTVSGYGVELALKRTDYIVIDDRPAEEQAEDQKSPGESALSEEEVSDLRPLSSSELIRLGPKAATFVLSSEDPFGTLLRLTQDFPKHSSTIASTNASVDLVREHTANRGIFLPAGYNALWINGVQIIPRDVDAYTLLEHLRRERRMIHSARELGLSGRQAIELLAHEAITASQVETDTQRYDWRDDSEGGSVIMWMNDIEKDKRYADWSRNINALLQRTFPGQLPPVRRDIHNLIFPVDFSSHADVLTVVESIQNFVKRKVPIRFGLVPVIDSAAGLEQAKTVYHLLDAYGLAAALDYLERSIKSAGRKFSTPEQQQFSNSIKERNLRQDKTGLTLQELLESTELDARISSAKAYSSRLGSTTSPPLFVNGAPVEKSEEWMQTMSQRINQDVRILQQYVYEQSWTDDTYLPDIFLAGASPKRNVLVIPGDDKAIRHLNVGELPFAQLPSLPANADTIEGELVHLTVAANFDSLAGFALLMEAHLFQKQHDNVELALLHLAEPSPDGKIDPGPISSLNLDSLITNIEPIIAKTAHIQAELEHNADSSGLQPVDWASTFEEVVQARSGESVTRFDDQISQSRELGLPIINAAGLVSGQEAFIMNGRLVGPFGANTPFTKDDLNTLLAYERKLRLRPAAAAIKALDLQDKASTPLAFARVSNLIALSLVSDIPEGIFEVAPTIRSSMFESWKSDHTALKIGDIDSAAIQIVAAIDPASETAQRWVPIIKSLSEMDGVYTRLFLNPRDHLEELPVKRFYRYVLSSRPTFESNGSLQHLGAHFSGLPAEALLNVGMDVPPAWLVAPKESVQDLDNIKLSAVKSGADIEAEYELEHILIEGHSRDLTLGPPPRGAQLVLGTDSDPHFADTIVMANLGYFQFKANPGLYTLALQKGRSEEIFSIESAGTKGYSPQPGDESTEIAMVSFRGATLFPRLVRNSGMEDEDVLEAPKTAVGSLVDQADKVLAQAGLTGVQTGKYLSKAVSFGSKLLPGALKASGDGGHAEINIFSVASGHLYERMLNIMMLSVMKHTKHTVKFWFIEQFLSPSFKASLPVLAEEYGFRYEMVTYKWPHWLREQKEKQREIWGYKILFLDVLFPLDLDKVIFVDADQIVRTDMYDLVQHDLKGAPYGFTPMCDSRTEMEGFRFWKQGYWKNFLRGLPYHISALYVVDLKKFRQIAAGDRLRQQYHTLSADPNSLSNLDQDLPNHMQMVLPIHSLPQDWLWCETWCSDEALKTAKTIDLCNNPQTKEPKLDRARRQVPEWTLYDEESAAVIKRHKDLVASEFPTSDGASHASGHGEEESIQERLQREDAEKEQQKQKTDRVRDEL